MHTFYVNFQRSAWLRALIMIILGGTIVAAPGRVFGMIVSIVAVILLAFGIINLIKGMRARRQGLPDVGVNVGVGLLIAAVLVWGLSGMIISMLPAFAGIGLLLYGGTMISGARSSRQYVNESTVGPTIYGILVVLAGIFLLFHPFGTAMFIFRVLGATLLVMGIMELINWFRYGRH